MFNSIAKLRKYCWFLKRKPYYFSITHSGPEVLAGRWMSSILIKLKIMLKRSMEKKIITTFAVAMRSIRLLLLFSALLLSAALRAQNTGNEPAPVGPQIRNMASSPHGPCSKSISASSIEAMLCSVNRCSFIWFNCLQPVVHLEVSVAIADEVQHPFPRRRYLDNSVLPPPQAKATGIDPRPRVGQIQLPCVAIPPTGNDKNGIASKPSRR